MENNQRIGSIMSSVMLTSLANNLDESIAEVKSVLINRQADDGYFSFELEADATIPAEYVLLNHYLGTPNDHLECRIANYLREIQGDDGGWPLYHRGEANVSASVKAYYALKLIGDPVTAPHMRRARSCILSLGGGANCNVFTRVTLALFEQIPWKAVPVMRVEAILLPKWFPFHIDKISYWSRTVLVPLFILYTLKPAARNPRKTGVAELFSKPVNQMCRYQVNPTGHFLGSLLIALDTVFRICEPLLPDSTRQIAINKAISFIVERLNGLDGLGAIFPAIANSVMAFDALGYSSSDPWYATARQSLDKLLVTNSERVYCQPCVSPVWDTALSCHALMEVGMEDDLPVLDKAVTWLKSRQVLDVVGDWGKQRPHLRPGGWAFQHTNHYYPDVDDSAVVIMALERFRRVTSLKNLITATSSSLQDSVAFSIARGVEWILGMQCQSGGWAAFNAENEHYTLNHIPFADHGALLDPPTADVSARCLSMLGQLGYDKNTHPAVIYALNWLRKQQETDGSWFGRWGANYIYGTWSVLTALASIKENMTASYVRRAVSYLKKKQREDGGWGEDCASYWEYRKTEVKESTPSQTAWALLGLMAAGEVNNPAVERGILYLLSAPRTGDRWHETLFTGVGFPRVFYLRYHGYSAYFPLLALARYRNLRYRGNLVNWDKSGI